MWPVVIIVIEEWVEEEDGDVDGDDSQVLESR